MTYDFTEFLVYPLKSAGGGIHLCLPYCGQLKTGAELSLAFTQGRFGLLAIRNVNNDRHGSHRLTARVAHEIGRCRNPNNSSVFSQVPLFSPVFRHLTAPRRWKRSKSVVRSSGWVMSRMESCSNSASL